jgi:hypothetical protein
MIPEGFKGAALVRSANIYHDIADAIVVPSSTFRAFLLSEVASETGFIDDGRPQALFERHKFFSFSNGEFANEYPTICNKKAGGYLKQPAEYDKRIGLAYSLNPHAALLSVSWGMGQIMGFNHARVGYATVESMVEAMCHSEDNHLWAFANFLTNTGIVLDLRNEQYRTAVTKYNGSGNVDVYLRKFTANLARVKAENNMQDRDAERNDLIAIQAVLNLLGYTLGKADGFMGPKTRSAVKAFQTDHGLKIDGVPGPETRAALFSDLPLPKARPLNF